MQIPMDLAKAAELKLLLRKRAEKANIDLTNPNNKYTLWTQNGAQGYLCCKQAGDEETMYRNMRFLPPAVLILEANESGDRVTLWASEVG